MRIFNKEYREYCKMLRRHRRELVRLARKTADFDYGYLDDFVITKIRHMYEYYTSNNNVCQSDNSAKEVISTLKTAIHKHTALEKSCWNDDDEDFLDLTKVKEAYSDFYAYIGKNITLWWD